MGQNSPIELQMTAAGLAAKDSVDNIIFTRFVAGAGGNGLLTEVNEIKQTIPIVDYQKYTAGNTYNINGVNTVATESSLKLTGFANAVDAEANYLLNEIGLMAKLTENGEEFCFAYDWTDTDTRRIRTTKSQGIQVVYNIIFSRQPNLTINTSESGVTYADFYAHVQEPVGDDPVHGMTWENGQLYINGQVFDSASNERIKVLMGIDLFYSILPNPSMTLYNKVALVTGTNVTYRCQKTEEISVGQFIINDNGWKRANGNEAEALLVIDDGLTPSVNEICLTDAQNHFMEWTELGDVDLRLSELEANNHFLQYDPLDNRTYNTEWVDRITGSGTPLSPYCIYTPKDFSMIGRTEQYSLDKVYKLMNNLDFTSAIGISVSINNEGYEITATNQQAPLYHNGEGYWPVGYNGYYPSAYVTDSEHPNGYYTPGGDPGPITWAEAKAVENFSYNANTTNIRVNPNYSNVDLYKFTGELDGNSKVIKGITCAPLSTFSVGLFMFLGSSASIHDLTIKDSIFILSDVWYQGENTSTRNSSIGSVAGSLVRSNQTEKTTVSIYNTYNYATLINNTSSTISGENHYSDTAGIVGTQNSQTDVYFQITNCANHGEMIYVSENPYHRMAGIIVAQNHGENNQEIGNCINTVSFTSKKADGIGYACLSKANLNCGYIQSYAVTPGVWNYGDHVKPVGGSEGERESTSVVFFNNQTYNAFSSDVRNFGKTPEYLKSEEFITEINSYLPIPAFVYNDLGVNDGWPLLVDEYNTLTGIDGNLSLAVVDPTNKKIYKSGLPMKKFQTIPTYKEMVENTNQTVETKITQFNTSTLAGLKIVTVTIETTDWSLDSGSNKYLATKSITDLTSTSPVQLLSQLSGYEITINSVSSNSITLECNSEPSSDIKISVMFTV